MRFQMMCQDCQSTVVGIVDDNQVEAPKLYVCDKCTARRMQLDALQRGFEILHANVAALERRVDQLAVSVRILKDKR